MRLKARIQTRRTAVRAPSFYSLGRRVVYFNFLPTFIDDYARHQLGRRKSDTEQSPRNNIRTHLNAVEKVLKTYAIADFLNNSSREVAFHINRLEGMERAAHIERPHKHDFYEIFLIEKGNIAQAIDYQTYTLSDNTLFFISRGQLHVWQTTENAESGYRLMFTEDFLRMHNLHDNFFFELIYLDNIYQHPFLQLASESTLIHQYFDCLYQEYNKSDAKEAVLSTLLFVLLSEIQYVFNKQNPSKSSPSDFILYKKFIHLLEENVRNNLSAQDYADRLFVSSRHLNRIVQKVAQQSTSQVIQNRVVLEAQRLLTFSTLNVSQIAEQLGFEDTSYFARSFKRSTQCSPLEFRSRVSEKSRNKLP